MSAGRELSRRTQERLTGFLRSLPLAHARALAEAAETARRAGDTALPHGFILEALRPVLSGGASQDGAADRAGAEDLFRRPFEDLIDSGGCGAGRGGIAEGSVAAVWRWLSEDVLPGRQDAAVCEVIAGSPEGEAPSRAAVSRFHQVCAQALTGELARKGGQEAAARLGGRQALEDAREMAAILAVADDALEIRERFPRPVKTLSAADLNALVLLFDDFASRHEDGAAVFFALVMGRLAEPWEVLRAMAHVSGRVHSGRPDAADTDAVMDRLLHGPEAGAEFFRRLNTADFEPADVARELRAFARMVNGISHAAVLPADGPRARRMMTCRSLVAEKMEILMERVPRDILAALPVHKIGRFGRVRRRPDIGIAPDPAKAAQALRMAKLVELCRPYAADAAFKVAFSEAVADAREGLHEYAAALIDEMKRHEADSPAPARAYLDLVIRLTAYVSGPDEAARLRRETAALHSEGMPDAAVS